MSSHDDTTAFGPYDAPETPREQRVRHTPPRPASGRHPVNVGHLVMGVAFLGLATVWLLVETETVALAESRWLLPLPWLAAGAAGLLATVLRRRDGADAGRDRSSGTMHGWQ